MEESPSINDSTVSSRSFTNIVDESGKLYNKLIQVINTPIISPRRWGKSSLVDKIVNNISQKEKRIKTFIHDEKHLTSAIVTQKY